MINQSTLIKLLAALLLLSSVASAWSPSDSYAPGKVRCPENHTFVREANSISSREQQWLVKRHQQTTANLRRFLESKTNISQSEIDKVLGDKANSSKRAINIGLAFSGGGYRAMLSGAGQLSALDNRTNGAFERGLGGLLESSSYIAGLSGGNWLVGSLSLNNWTSVQDVLDHKSKLWDLEHSIFLPEGLSRPLDNYETFKNISNEVKLKEQAGFSASITDYWGRALSRNFFPSMKDDGAAFSWSDLREAKVFQNAQMPFPISLADGRYPGTTIVDLNSTNFEFNPFEMGSWDPTLNAFVDIKYIGTELINGQPSSSSSCVIGLDNAGYVLGTSSSLFNQFLVKLSSPKAKLQEKIKSIAIKILTKYSSQEDDIAVYELNPFQKAQFAKRSNNISNSETLYLVDGGEDGQNIPLSPLLTPERNMDVVLAFDNGNDIYGFPNGKSLVHTYQRQFGPVGNNRSFPYVPDTNTFLASNLTTKPVFFGCDAKNLTSLSGGKNNFTPPLIVYIANRPFSFWSNTSTFKMQYTEKERQQMISNGFEVASRNNLTLDHEWTTCLGCALIRRTQERNEVEQSKQCQQCFTEYCWNGDIANQTAPANYMATSTVQLSQNGQQYMVPQQQKSGLFLKVTSYLKLKIFPNGM